MKNPLILNIRCVCIDEYMELQRIHNNYRKLRSEGEILSIYVGAKRELYGQNKVVDKMLDKVFGDKSKPIPTERIMREEVVGAQGNADGTVTETVERVVRPDALPRNELMYEESDDNSHKSADQQKDRFLIVSLALFSCLFNAVEFLAVIKRNNLLIGINVIVFLRLFDFQCIEQRAAYDDPPDQRADCSQILHQGHSRQDAQ